MAEVIRMPRLSDTMEEGNIVGWQKQVGDKVAPGDILAEVETDKATMELESFNDGYLLHIGVPEGAVAVEGVIAIIGEKGEDITALLAEVAAEAAAPKAAPAAEEPKAAVATPTPAPRPVPTPTPAPAVITHNDGRIFASPLAKRMSKEAGIDINRIAGSGENGRVVKRDIESAIANGGASGMAYVPGALASASYDPTVYGDKPVSQMRKIIAKRLGESKFSAPHFYLTMEINMDKMKAAREAINEESPIRISFNDLVVKASAVALRKHPDINASWLGDKITYHEDINIGVAVAIDEGLMVPVVRNADRKTLVAIKSEIKDLAGKAKSRKISPEEMLGNTFTISNLGMFDIEDVGSIIAKPIVVDGAIAIGNMMKVTLSCDHRIVDGAKGAAFLQTLKGIMENPVKLWFTGK